MDSLKFDSGLSDYRYVNNLGANNYFIMVTPQFAYDCAKEFFRMDHVACKSVKRGYLYKRISDTVVTRFELDCSFVVENGEIVTLKDYENR